jgi:flagellar hook-associated protein 1 FlgK
MNSLFGIGISSLYASKYALTVTNQNIANAQNPHYSRRIVSMQETHFGKSGKGVLLLDVQRISDAVINRNLLRSKSNASSAEYYHQQFVDFESLLDDSTTSVASYMKQSLTELSSLNVSPSSIQNRNLYLYQLNNIKDRFNQVSKEIESGKVNIQRALQGDVEKVNVLTKQIAEINERIQQSDVADSEENMSLMDERDRLLNTLAEYINFELSTDQHGGVTVQIGSGVPLVYSNQSATLMTLPSAEDPTKLDIAIDNAGHPQVITPFISGGKMAASKSFEQNGLDAAQMNLNRLALAFAFKMNEQHQLGVNLNGRLGGNIFTDMNAADISSNRVLTPTTNSGSGTLSVAISDVSQLRLSDYKLTFITPTQYQLVRKSDNAEVSTGTLSGTPFELTVDGFTLKIDSANFAAGDQFTLSPTKGAAEYLKLDITDPRQLALGFPVVTSPSESNTGAGKITFDQMIDTTTPAFSTPGELSPPVIVDFVSPTQYRLLNATDNSVIEDNLTYDPAAGMSLFPTPGGYDPGYRASISGEVHAGDQFQINYNHSGLSDNRNGLLLADLYQQGILEDSSLNFIQGYNSISDDISSKANVAKMIDTAQSIILSQAELRRDELSGVSLEEEAMNLARYQETFQASAQILDSVRSMFDAVITMMRR